MKNKMRRCSDTHTNFAQLLAVAGVVLMVVSFITLAP